MASRVKKETEKIQEEEKKMVYCGPHLAGMPQFTVLMGIPQFMQIHIASCPAVERLIVPLEKLNSTRLKLLVKGSYEQKMYLQIQNYLQGGQN